VGKALTLVGATLIIGGLWAYSPGISTAVGGFMILSTGQFIEQKQIMATQQAAFAKAVAEDVDTNKKPSDLN